MDAQSLQREFLKLNDREAVLRHTALYRPTGKLTRAESEGRLTTKDDLRELFGPSLLRESWDNSSATGHIHTPYGHIVSTIFYRGEPHRAWMLRTIAEGIAQSAVKLLPVGFADDILGDATHKADPLHVWLVAVHILTGQQRIQRTPADAGGAVLVHRFGSDGFPPEICFSLLENIGTQSCEALDRLPRLAHISANIQAGTVTIGGVVRRGVAAEVCQVVVALLQAEGTPLHWLDLKEQCPTLGEKQDREMKKVREILGEYLKSDNKGYRMIF